MERLTLDEIYDNSIQTTIDAIIEGRTTTEESLDILQQIFSHKTREEMEGDLLFFYHLV